MPGFHDPEAPPTWDGPFVKEFGRITDPALSDADASPFIDEALFEFALAPLVHGTMDVDYRMPYTYVRMLNDIDPFITSHEFVNLWGVFPPDYEGFPIDTRGIPLIVDVVPDGFVPDPPFYIYHEVGTTDKRYCIEWVAKAIALMDYRGADSRIDVSFGPFDEAYAILSRRYVKPLTLRRQRLRMVEPIGHPGVALNASSPDMRNGGYAFQTRDVGMFACRGDDRGDIKVCFNARIPGAGGSWILEDTVSGVDRTPFATIRLDSTAYLLAADFDHLLVKGTGDALSGVGDIHIEMASLELPVKESGILAAGFGVAGNAGDEANFRKGHAASGAAMFLNRNGVQHIGDPGGGAGNHVPFIQGLWSPQTGGGDTGHAARWENELAQLGEPWVGFSPYPNSPAAILGKLPGAMVAHGAIPAASNAPFRFDANLGFRQYTVYQDDTNAEATTLLVGVVPRKPAGPDGKPWPDGPDNDPDAPFVPDPVCG